MDNKTCNLITIYHGSPQIVDTPAFGLGRKHNDFGQGFYCTESSELAKEWAVSSLRDGFSNRLFSIRTPIARRAKQYLIENFGINVNAYDLITGYRADDSYFEYAEAFLNNAITVEQLARAMKLGKLGEQIVLKSPFAFSKITYEGFEVAEKERYYVLRKARDDEANQMYLNIQEEDSDGLYMQDILRGGIANNDPRIPRNISE